MDSAQQSPQVLFLDIVLVALVLIEQSFTFALAVFATVLTQDLSETQFLSVCFFTNEGIFELKNGVSILVLVLWKLSDVPNKSNRRKKSS